MFNIFHNLTPASSWGFICLYAFLVIAWLFLYGFSSRLKESTKKELCARIKTWFYIISGLAVLLMAPRSVSIFGFMIVSFFAFKEYVKSVSIREADQSVVYFIYLAIPVQYFWILINWYNMAMVFIPVYIFLSIPLFLILSKETHGFLRSVGIIFWGAMAAVFCLSHVALLFCLPEHSGLKTSSLLFFLLFLTSANDVAQYLWGKMIGKTQITPISPNKTWGGLIGGVVSTSVFAYFISPYFTPFDSIQALLCGFIIGFCGFIGDVCMSAIKRDIGVKDYSSFLPGHGGVLDRLDSLIYTAPLFFHFIHYLYY